MKLTRLLPRFDSLDLSASNDAANKAVNTGQTAINSYDPTASAQGVQKQTTNLGGQLAGQTNDYITRYAEAVKNNPTVTQLYNQGNAMYNVPALAKQSASLQNRVTNAVPDAFAAARGFDIDSTDINNGVASKLAYLTPQSNAATNNYNTAAGLASQFVTAGQAQNMQNLLPIQAEAPLLAQSEAAQATGWNNAAQQELEGLLAKMQAGITLSATEMSRANQLAQSEEAYQQAVATNAANIQQAQIGNQYKILSPAQTLVNTFTGKSQRA